MYAYKERRGDDRGESTDEHATEGGVECPECGTANGSEFRYCRECVAELPSGMSFVRERSGPDSRQSL